jgi:phage-related protein
MTGARWRHYRTEGGSFPVREYLAGLDAEARELVLAAMREASLRGRIATRQVSGEIREVRATRSRSRDQFRVLFAYQGRRDQVMLALVAFTKKTETTPSAEIKRAERRLGDWLRRGGPPARQGR